jgi:hypothetical protein
MRAEPSSLQLRPRFNDERTVLKKWNEPRCVGIQRLRKPSRVAPMMPCAIKRRACEGVGVVGKEHC